VLDILNWLAKRISKLERWLTQEGYPQVDRDIKFLRRLQTLRSVMSAHGKGSSYKKALERENVDEDPIREMVHMFWSAQAILRGLAAHFGVDLDSY
jgi:uncharacterized protein YjhX (UPF0386 family)